MRRSEVLYICAECGSEAERDFCGNVLLAHLLFFCFVFPGACYVLYDSVFCCKACNSYQIIQTNNLNLIPHTDPPKEELSEGINMLKSELSEKNLLILQSEMELKKRSTIVAYIIFLITPLALIGGHHWYLRNHGKAIAYPICGILIFAMANSQVFFLGAYLLFMAIDFFTLAYQVGQANRRIESEIIESIGNKKRSKAA